MLKYKLISFLGLISFLFIAYLLSNNKKAIKFRVVISGILLQFLIGLLILKSPLASSFFMTANRFFAKLLAFSNEGTLFVFGALSDVPLMGKVFGPQYGFSFVVQVTGTIILVGTLTAVLYHFGIMQIIISFFGRIMQKTMGVSGAESFVTAANVFAGMTEAPLVIKPYLAKLTRSEITAMMVGGFATVSGGVLAAYAGLGIDAGHLLSASFMNAPAALVLAKILIPETEKPLTMGKTKLIVDNNDANAMDAACRGAGDGIKLAINVMAMLIGILALIALINYLIGSLGSLVGLNNLTLQAIFGYLFAPCAWLMGIPSQDILSVGQLIGQKTILNEFITFIELAKNKAFLDPRSTAIATYALCGFANFSSIAIQIGGISSIVPERRADFAKLAWQSLVGGTLACFLSACIAGILI